MSIKQLSPEERGEYAEMLDSALNGSRQADQPAIDRMESFMAQADRTGRDWPSLLYRYWQREGIRSALKAHAKSQSRALVAYNGNLITKDTRRGVTRWNPTAGREVWQQVLFEDMTWEELDQYRKRNAEQIESLRINEVMAVKLDALRVLAPESVGVKDACEQLGTSIETVLSA
jgi:hypothetical protein